MSEGEAQPAASAAPDGPVGVMDSGVGGLSVLRHLRAELPAEAFLYFADQAHIPYGPRPAEQVFAFTAAITRFLLARQAKLVVVACNTATTAALDRLRQTFPALPFVGMEPAVKPAAAQTRSGVVGVLATPGTLSSHRYASLMARFAADIRVLEDPCLGLVPLIEAGATQTAETRALLQRAVAPMLAAGADTLVLGCTHYPFIRPLLGEIAGPDVTIIDPAPAVARHTRNVVQQRGQLAPETRAGALRCYTTGDAARMAVLTADLLGVGCRTRAVRWTDNEVIANTRQGTTDYADFTD
ncbi:MAG: glutamate racemase [Candidatus Promineofilum sp.]|nr:glutamate racemase [Promineifilum sp.]